MFVNELEKWRENSNLAWILDHFEVKIEQKLNQRKILIFRTVCGELRGTMRKGHEFFSSLVKDFTHSSKRSWLLGLEMNSPLLLKPVTLKVTRHFIYFLKTNVQCTKVTK